MEKYDTPERIFDELVKRLEIARETDTYFRTFGNLDAFQIDQKLVALEALLARIAFYAKMPNASREAFVPKEETLFCDQVCKKLQTKFAENWIAELDAAVQDTRQRRERIVYV